LINTKSLKNINWALVWSSLTQRERFLVYGFATAILVSVVTLGVQFYYSNTKSAPRNGGTHTEASIEIPRFINPVLAQVNDTDRDITRLIYSGLVKYTKEGRLVEDLAESYSIENNTIYKFILRENIQWHDGKPLTSDDVVFTIKLIQDPKYASPIRSNWQGVEVENPDERTVIFKLTSAYSPFLENATVGILPKHIWENISPKSFVLTEENLKPIGSGPYKFNKFQKDKDGNIKSYALKSNEKYYLGPPYIEHLIFKFFESENDALKAMKSGDVNAMSLVSGYNSTPLEEDGGTIVHNFSLPRYFAVFFNQSKSKALQEKEVRKALALSINREEIIDVATGGQGAPAYGPIIRELLGYNPQIEEKYKFSPEQAKSILKAAQWKDVDGDGILEKRFNAGEEPSPLEFTLITVGWPDFTELEKATRVLQEQWREIGVKVNIIAYPPGELQQEFIRPREYEALLFGQIVGIDPDPFSFWHSSQKKDPGLNIALYGNKTVDRLLEEARQTFDAQSRAGKYVEFQNIISDDIPALFLYSPTYLYPVDSNVKGISEGKIADPSWRFADVNEWYIDTKRVWK